MAITFSTVNFGDIRGNTTILEPTDLSVKINEINETDTNFAKFKNSSGIALGLNAKVLAKSGVGSADDDEHYWIKDKYKDVPELSDSKDYVHIFTDYSKEHTFTAPYGITKAKVLIVGGGGGFLAGNGASGYPGCGAGAVYYGDIDITGGKTYKVVVGNGFKTNSKYGSGENSYIECDGERKEAKGGGTSYKTGGCSGGTNLTTAIACQSGENIFANVGGYQTKTGTSNDGTGGGGAGSAGEAIGVNIGRGGKGGNGIQINITGEDTWYAAGGGGGDRYATRGQPGDGEYYDPISTTFKKIGGYGACNSSNGTNGKDGTGSGGGGPGGGKMGGAGGSGIVVIRYTVPQLQYVGTALGEGAVIGVDAQGSIQIGSGTNNEKDTIQIREYPFLDENGIIPEDRFPDNLKNSELSATVYNEISSNIRSILGDPMIFKGVFNNTTDYKRGDVVLTNFFEYVCSVDNQPHGEWSAVSAGFVYLGDEGSYVKRGEIVDSDISPEANIQMSKVQGLSTLREEVTDIGTKVQTVVDNYVPKSSLGDFAACDYKIMTQQEYDALPIKDPNTLYLISPTQPIIHYDTIFANKTFANNIKINTI